MELEEFKSRLKEAGISSVKEFGNITNLSYHTVSKWGNSTPVPSWVDSFLSTYKQNKDLEDVKQLIKELAAKID